MKLRLLIIAFSLLAFGFTARKIVKRVPEQIRILTYNIRYDSKEDEDKGWGWNSRKMELCNSLKLISPDIFCIQEGLINQVNYLEESLSEYKWVGVGRDDGKKSGEFSAIFFKSNKFDLIASGTFWLSETPDVPGKKGWDAACTRIVTWVKLKTKENGTVFYHFNTHFDHMGVVARKESAKLILNKIKELAQDLPFTLSGDFNAPPDSEPIKLLENPKDFSIDNTEGLQNAYKSALNVKSGPAYTYVGFDVCGSETKEFIDFIFAKKGMKILNYYVLALTINQHYISDHLPVFVDINL